MCVQPKKKHAQPVPVRSTLAAHFAGCNVEEFITHPETLAWVKGIAAKDEGTQIMDRSKVEKSGIKSLNEKSLTDAAKQIEAQLQEARARTRGAATVIILQSDLSDAKLTEAGFNYLLNEFPVLRAPVTAEDNLYPALDWERFAVKRAA